ncbi:MAG: DUF4212 domain-containing protein [Planctomycetes bacterium]|nr:DUF4212 domain-containing protein [Planctomycetota bacterium]
MSDRESIEAAKKRYVRSNVRVIAILLVVWAIAGLGCGVLLADVLDRVKIGGFPLGFWFAQQGSIVVFVVLILVYAVWMSRIDRRYRREVRDLDPERDDS